MTLWTLMVREIGRRPSRALLTLLSIAIGTAAVVSILLAAAASRRTCRQMYEAITGRAALQVTAEGGGPFAEDAAAAIASVPGVHAAVPSVQRFARLYFQGKSYIMFAMGIDPAKESAVRDYELCEGEFFHDGGGILLEAGFARLAGIRVGDEVKLMTPLPRRRPPLKHVTVVGLLSPRGAAGFQQGGAFFLPLPLAERLFTGRGKITAVDVVLAGGADERAVRAAIQERLPQGLHAAAAAARTELAQATFQKIEHALQYATALTVVLAVFIVSNAFLMNVSERRPQLAVLRAVGATRGQLVRLLLAEALVIGAAGTILGCLAGWGGGYALMRATAQLFAAAPPKVVLAVEPFLLAAILGPGVAAIAAYIPIRLIRDISPLEAMRPQVGADRRPRLPPAYAPRNRAHGGQRCSVGGFHRRPRAPNRLGHAPRRDLHGVLRPLDPLLSLPAGSGDHPAADLVAGL